MNGIILYCPKCTSGICYPNTQTSAWVCSHCKVAHPQLDGYIDFLSNTDDTHASPGLEHAIGELLTRLSERLPLPQAASEAYLQAAKLRGNERIVELFCGGGSLSQRLAASLDSGHVVGLDFHSTLLRWASKQTSERPRGSITWVRASAFNLPLMAGSVDQVYCRLPLSRWRHREAMLLEIQRVLNPQGCLLLPESEAEGRPFRGMASWLRRLAGAPRVRVFSRDQLGDWLHVEGAEPVGSGKHRI